MCRELIAQLERDEATLVTLNDDASVRALHETRIELGRLRELREGLIQAGAPTHKEELARA